MKRLLIVILLPVLILYGCSSAKAVKETPQETKPPQANMGIVSNNYKFENITLENAAQKVADVYEKNKENLNVAAVDDNKYTYIIAMMGQKPTAGYSIKVVSIEDNEEGKLKITVKLENPPKDSMVAQVITYPVDIVRLPITNLPMYAVDTEGNKIKFEAVK